MTINRNAVREDVIAMLEELAADWEYEGEITEDTGLLLDMGLDSLDLVVLATTVQEKYGAELPFTAFFAMLGERDQLDVTVQEWIDFIHGSLNGAPSPAGGIST